MGPGKAIERFTDAVPATTVSQQMISPTLKNLLATPDVSVQPVTVDPLKRELEIVEVKAYPVTLIETAADSESNSNSAEDDDESKSTSCPSAKTCPKCPDMSQYIRMDEIPCWNCTLP